MKPKLTLADFVRAAALLQCEVAAIWAVAKKESSGGGFLKGRIMTVRFEGHIFEQKTGGQYSESHPTLSHPYMRNCPHNKGTIPDWRRLEEARQLAGDVAFECASYGLFQIMGFHYAMLGYDSAYAMVQAFNEGEGKQLDGFCLFIRKNGLAVYLRKLMFEAFALRYNGKDHAANNYGPDMRAYYDEFRAAH